MSTHRLVRCERHGDNREAFVCKHLLLGAGLEFFSDAEDPSNPYPDAWCSECEKARDESGALPDGYARSVIKLVCGSCYQEIKAKHIVRPENSGKLQ